MARTPGTEVTLAAATRWRERCLLADGSVFTDRQLWTLSHLAELEEHFINRPDEGDRSFMEKLHAQLDPVSAGAKQLAAEMLWFMLLFPNNLTPGTKIDIVTTIWGWSHETLSREDPEFAALHEGIGSAGMGYNSYRPYELALLVRIVQGWKALPRSTQESAIGDPWAFAEFVDGIEGADHRQLRHMMLHLLFPDTFERVASADNKRRIIAGYQDLIQTDGIPEDEHGGSWIARDRRILHIRQLLESQNPEDKVDFYWGKYQEKWRPDEPEGVGQPGKKIVAEPKPPRQTPPVQDDAARDPASITEDLRALDFRIDMRTVRRYHLALASRGFVILSGVSGTGKTWLAEAYAKVTGAHVLVVPVAPNWTTNEDLLGFVDPFGSGYRDTQFSRFLRRAAAAHADARKTGKQPAQYHLVLDEMNLARVEYYFARFLSAMELRMRDGEAVIELGPNDSVVLPPNLYFIGTVNVDETTHGFAEKVYDRAQLIEMPLSRAAIQEQLGTAPYAQSVLSLWDALRDVAPFAFRVLDDIAIYVEKSREMGVAWEDAIDELILQKILPKIRGTDPRAGDALQAAVQLTNDRFPLSNEKARAMKAGIDQRGIASFF